MSLITEESKVTTRDGIKLYMRKDIPDNPKAIIILVHGVCEHCGRYEYTTSKLNSFGYGVYRYDNRGHGKSSGARGHVKNFMDYTDDANAIVSIAMNEYPKLPVYMFGHSMGAFITACYGIQYPGKINGQIFSGLPAIELPLPSIKLLKRLPYNIMPKLKASNKLGSLVSRDKSVIDEYNKDPLNLRKQTIKMSAEMFLKGPEWLKNNINSYSYPCLILHGGGDLIVTPESSKWFFKSIASIDKKLKIYDELYHEILNEKERDTILDDIHEWLEKRI